MAVDTPRIRRYRSQSLRLLGDAMDQMRGGRWGRAEDLLWGSLTQAIKGVALNNGRELDGDEAVRAYATELGQETRDRRIRDAFDRLASFGDLVQGIRESRSRVDRLYPIIEDVSGAVERLWELVPRDEED